MNNLEDIKKQNPFKVPENYFENFNVDIMSKLPQKDNKTTEEHKDIKQKPTLWKKILPWTAVAAACCGILVFIGIFPGQDATTINDKTTAQQSKDAITTNASTSNIASTPESEEFYLFLEDETTKSLYYDKIGAE